MCMIGYWWEEDLAPEWPEYRKKDDIQDGIIIFTKWHGTALRSKEPWTNPQRTFSMNITIRAFQDTDLSPELAKIATDYTTTVNLHKQRAFDKAFARLQDEITKLEAGATTSPLMVFPPNGVRKH